MLFQMDDLHLSGRDFLYKVVIEEVKNNPILGIGLAGDRRLINTYVHNIVLEILANFGTIIGSAFIILLALISFKTLFLSNKKVFDMISIWISIGLVHLIISSSYLLDFKFWIFLGLAIRHIRVFKIHHKIILE
jgi:O-antigen ligase